MLRSRAATLLLVPILLLTGASAPGSRAWADDLPPLRAEHPPLFVADLAITLDADGHPGLSAAVTVPYSSLQWVRSPGAYAAGAEVAVAFEPTSRNRVYGDVWERRVTVPSFGATMSPNASLAERRSFDVPPGRYRVRVSVRDINADRVSVATESLVVPDYSRVPVGFGDLELGIVDTLGNFTMSATRRFGLDVSRLAARVALFDRRPGNWPRTYALRTRILDERGEEVVTGQQSVQVVASAAPVVVRPASSDLFLGNYQFEVLLVEGKARWRADRSFEVEESGPPRGKEWDRMLEALSYIAEPGEVEQLRALPPDQQARGWDEFWHRRDPSPDTPRNEAMIEFFRRVRYADQHFQGAGPGWRSDMGRIYIRYGPPDQTESHAASSTNPQLEIWFYNRPYRRFVFADRDGFGRYVLMSPGYE